jgi:hypothetical protein
MAGLDRTVRCKNQLRRFVWWPGSHPESQNAQVDWLCVGSHVLSYLIHMVGLPHSTIGITTSFSTHRCGAEVGPTCRRLPLLAAEVSEAVALC